MIVTRLHNVYIGDDLYEFYNCHDMLIKSHKCHVNSTLVSRLCDEFENGVQKNFVQLLNCCVVLRLASTLFFYRIVCIVEQCSKKLTSY